MLLESHKPIGITLQGMSGKDRPMMEFFLQKHWSSQCIIVPNHQANICILDLDGVEGKKLLQQQQVQYPERPLIVLSVHDNDINGARVLRKPLKVGLFKETIDLFRSEFHQRHQKTVAESSQAPQISVTLDKSAPIAVKRKKSEPRILTQSAELNERRIGLPDAATQARLIHGALSKGHRYNNRKEATFGDTTHYNNKNHLPQILIRAIAQCRENGQAAKLRFQDGKHITLLPKSNLSLTNMSDSKLRPRCLLAMRPDQFSLEVLRHNEADLLQNLEAMVQPINALLWKVSIWSSRGRLPEGIAKDLMVGLRQWPNLTRLLSIPEFIRIAALWTTSPTTLPRTYETLNIDCGYVYAFFSACQTLDMVEVYGNDASNDLSANNKARNKSKSGILKRLLRRLRAI